MSDELHEAREYAWQALSAWPLRRSMLGRERCDALVRTTLGQITAAEIDAASLGRCDDYRKAVCRRIERRVKSVYAENCGMAFMTLVLIWAISTIVQILVARWLNSRHAAEAGS
jgi:hypothetical protein